MLFLRTALLSSASFIVLAATIYAADPIRNLAALIADYKRLPDMPNEELIEGLMSNSMMKDYLRSPTEKMKEGLNELQFNETEKAVLSKQLLLGKIFQQAVLETRDLSDLRRILLEGVPHSLPGIQRLMNIETVYEVLFLLVQREEARLLVFDIMREEGLQYPSTDSFARGLARFAATAAVDGMRFEGILRFFDALYAAQEVLQPKFPDHKYHIGSIANEIARKTYNPAFGDPLLRERMFKNVFDQVQKRAPGAGVRPDLLAALASVPGLPEDVNSFIKEILRHSDVRSDVVAVLRGLSVRSDGASGLNIFHSIDRLAKLGMAEEATLALVSILNNKTPAVSELKELLPSLFRHPNPLVRRTSVQALGRKQLDREFVRAQLLNLLSDLDSEVRYSAIQRLAYLDFDLAFEFKERLVEMTNSDPHPGNRRAAEEMSGRAIRNFNRFCAEQLLPPKKK